MAENRKNYFVFAVGTNRGNPVLFLQEQDDKTDVIIAPTTIIAMSTLAANGVPVEHRHTGE